MDKHESSFVWDAEKEFVNIKWHSVDFKTAALVFKDSKRKIYTDSKHSEKEERYFCIGKMESKILTVRFTYRAGKIRIFGAGY